MRGTLLATAIAVPFVFAPTAFAQTSAPTAPPGAAAPQMPKLTEADILRALEAKGYTDVRSIKNDGDEYQIRAKKNGQSVVLMVDARAGTYTETAG